MRSYELEWHVCNYSIEFDFKMYGNKGRGRNIIAQAASYLNNNYAINCMFRRNAQTLHLCPKINELIEVQKYIYIYDV